MRAMVPTRRAAGVAALCTVLGAVAGFLAGRLLSPPTRMVETIVERPTSVPDSAAPGLAARASPASPPSAPAGARLAAPLGSHLDVDVGLAGARGSSIDALVLDASGGPVAEATVYALAEGTRPCADWASEACPWPHATSDARGHARIRLGAAGRYDVAARTKLEFTRVTDVRVDAGGQTEIALRFPPTEPIEVRVEADLACSAHRLILQSVRGDDDHDWFPTPGQAAYRERVFVIQGKGERIDLPPARFTARVECCDSPSRCRSSLCVRPLQFTAPCVLVIQPYGAAEDPAGSSGRLYVRVTAHAIGRAPSAGRSEVTVRAIAKGKAVSEASSPIWWAGEAPTETWCALTLPRDEPVLVQWTGTGVEPGSAETTGTDRRLDVDVHVRAESIRPSLAGLDVIDVDGTPLPWDAGQPCPWSIGCDDGWWGSGTVRSGTQWAEQLATFAGRRVTVMRGAWRTSRPVDIPLSGGARVTLELGGYVMVHVPAPLPADAGILRLERLDGGWLGWETATELCPPSEVGDESDPLSAVFEGTLLGPLPAGDVPLKVTLGGVEVGRVVAKVKAGEVTVLSLR